MYIGEYLDYSNCNCRKKLVDPLVEECTENIEETKLVKKTLDENKDGYNFCIVYRALFWIFFHIIYNQHCNCYLFCLSQVREL